MSGWRIQVQEAVEAAQPELRVTGVEVAEGEDADTASWGERGNLSTDNPGTAGLAGSHRWDDVEGHCGHEEEDRAQRDACLDARAHTAASRLKETLDSS